MKERIEKIVIAILFLVGLTVSFALIKHYLPAWAYWSCWGVITAYALYLVSKPESKKYYWYYTYIEKDDDGLPQIGYGLQTEEREEVDFYNFYKSRPNAVIFMVARISKKQYYILSEFVKSRKEDE